jgi:hypothetical protein
MKEAPVRRIVTGHDAAGRAIIQEDGPVPRARRIGGDSGPVFFEVWNTQAMPAPIDRASGEPPEAGICWRRRRAARASACWTLPDRGFRDHIARATAALRGSRRSWRLLHAAPDRAIPLCIAPRLWTSC